MVVSAGPTVVWSRIALALDSPDSVQTLAVMDAARPVPQTETQARFVRDFVEPSVAQYRAGGKAASVDTFLRRVFGSNYRGALDEGLPGAFDQAVADADAFFTQELPALQRWSLTQEDASRVTQPVLAVLGEWSVPTFVERRELLLSWLPNVEPFDLPGASHLLHVQNPSAMADALSGFFARHHLTQRHPSCPGSEKTPSGHGDGVESSTRRRKGDHERPTT